MGVVVGLKRTFNVEGVAATPVAFAVCGRPENQYANEEPGAGGEVDPKWEDAIDREYRGDADRQGD